MSSNHPSIELSFEKPIVIMRFIGKTPKHEMMAVLDELQTGTAGWSYSITMCDLTRQTETISAETRKAIADAPPNPTPGRGTVMFGASFAVRTVATLLMNVMNIAGKQSDNPNKFVDTEEQARAWIKERIAQIG